MSKKVVQALLQDSQWIVDEELSIQNNPIYRHADGRLLIVFAEGKGRLVEIGESQAFIDMTEATKTRLRENPHGRHILVDRLPQGVAFEAHVPALIAELPKLLNLSPDDLDFSQASLVKIDTKLKKQGRAKCIHPPLFPALVAYIGEMYNRKTGSKWYIRHDTGDNRVWEPWLVHKERVCNLASNLFDALNERYLSLHKIVNSHDLWWHTPFVGFWQQNDTENG
jgi:hypothetical protein